MAPAYEQFFAIRQLVISDSSWTDLVGPAVIYIACQAVVIYNPANQIVNLRSDPGNAASQLPGGIQPGGSFQIGSNGRYPITTQVWRFQPSGPPLCSLQSISGVVTLGIECIP